MKVLWFFPTAGDGHYLGTTKGERPADYDYLQQIAVAIDRAGFYGALLPTGAQCEDSWLVASALMPFTRQLRFLVALRPGVMSPTLSARMAVTFDRISRGRLLLNIVTGGDPEENARFGNYLEHDARYDLTDEFLTIWRGAMQGEIDFEGDYLKVSGARVPHQPVQTPYPPLYFGGSSPAGRAIGAKHADTYLLWGEPPAVVAEKVARMRELAAQEGRTLNFGLRLHVIVRETEAEAWDAAERLIQYVDESTIKSFQDKFAKFDSTAQKEQTSLHGGSKDRNKLELYPNLWAGIGLAREGAGTALVGDPETVAARLQEYQAAGIDTFILSGYPHLEEAIRVGELLLPILPLNHE